MTDPIRMATVEDLQAAGLEPGMAEHVYDNQIYPQLQAEHARAHGIDMEAAFVKTTPGAPGYPVTCHGCGATATLPTPLPAGKAAMCPRCMREGRTGADTP